jgi:hypothetical protein
MYSLYLRAGRTSRNACELDGRQGAAVADLVAEKRNGRGLDRQRFAKTYISPIITTGINANMI